MDPGVEKRPEHEGAVEREWAPLFGSPLFAQGAHFLSHNLWTASLCWLISLAVYDLLLYRPSSVPATDLAATIT